MDNSSVVSTNLFQHHFAAYQTNPVDLLLPTLPSEQIELLDAAKVTIADALAHSSVDRAQQVVNFAWAVANRTTHPEHTALAHWCHALLLSNRDIRKTLSHFDQALLYYRQNNRTEEEGRILIGYAHHLNLLGRLDEAEAAIQRAINALHALPDYRDWPIAYINAATIQAQRGDYRAMGESARKAEKSAKEMGEKNPERIDYYEYLCGNALINQGFAALALSDFAEAESLLTAGLQIAQKHNASELLGHAALNLGRLATYRGQLFAGLQWLEQARQAFSDAEIDIDQATVALEESILYERLMMASQARSAALEAAQAFAKAGIVSESVEAYLMAVQVCIKLEEAKRATRILAEIRDIVPKAAPLLRLLYQGYCAHPLLLCTDREKREALKSIDEVCRALTQMGAKPEALEMTLLRTKLAIEVAGTETTEKEGESEKAQDQEPSTHYQKVLQDARQIGLPLIEYQASIALAEHQTAKERHQTVRRAADLIVALRQQMQPEELKANLLSGYLPVYKELIAAQHQSGESSAATQTLLEAKGGIWSDMARPQQANPLSKAWVQARSDLTRWQEELRWALESIGPESTEPESSETEPSQKNSEEVEPDYVALCQQKILTAEKALTAAARLQTRTRTNTPLPLPSITDIQQQIAANACVLEYLVGQQTIELCIIKNTGKPIWIQLSETQDVQRIMRRMHLLLATMRNAPKSENERQQIAAAQQAAIDTLLSQLYALLIDPIDSYLADKTELIIAPDEFLFEVPWTALFDGTSYLGEKHLISLLPSSALLAMRRDNIVAPKSQADSSALLLGNAGIPALTNLASELEHIQQTIPASRLINPAASTDLIWTNAPSIVHIAAHGHINQQSPLLSGLALADGPFLLADVLNLNLQGTDLVTLSACQTGAIPVKGGLLLALAGAFLCAGANHVLASLWPVDDEATTIFMQTFYSHLQKRNQPFYAQQQAQEAVRQAGYRHPFYWAAFQLLSGFSITQ